ncbi:MAG: serine hydrolase [Desulfobaccales bacterium]
MISKPYKNFVAALLLGLLAVITVSLNSGEGATSPTLPFRVSDAEWRPLGQRGDQGLQARLDQALKREKLWQALISTGKMAVGLVDLSDPAKPRFAQVNGNTMMYAASLPKLAILLAAFQGFQDGSLKETPQIKGDLIEMIRRSDNFAASQMVARIGLKKIERVILNPRYQFYDAKKGGGIWVGGSFARAGEQNPEPLKNLIQAATVNQVCRFYYLLAYGRLINPENSRQMLKILAFPDLHDKFVSVLEKEVPPNCMYRKSGEFRIWYSDSILVWGQPSKRYILVALVEHQQGEQILRKLVPLAEQMLRPH